MTSKDGEDSSLTGIWPKIAGPAHGFVVRAAQETAVDCGVIFVWSGCFPPHTLGTAMSLWMLRCRGVAPTLMPFDTANILLLARSLSLARCLEAFDSSLPAPISSGIARATLFRCVRMGYGIAGRWSGMAVSPGASRVRSVRAGKSCMVCGRCDVKIGKTSEQHRKLVSCVRSATSPSNRPTQSTPLPKPRTCCPSSPTVPALTTTACAKPWDHFSDGTL